MWKEVLLFDGINNSVSALLNWDVNVSGTRETTEQNQNIICSVERQNKILWIQKMSKLQQWLICFDMNQSKWKLLAQLRKLIPTLQSSLKKWKKSISFSSWNHQTNEELARVQFFANILKSKTSESEKDKF